MRIGTVMAVIAIIALNFVIVPGIVGAGPMTFPPSFGFLIVSGAVPMADILVLAYLVGRRNHSPFLAGFEAFGFVALVCFVYMATHAGDAVREYHLRVWAIPVEDFLKLRPLHVRIAVLLPLWVIVLIGPQLAVALAGGFLSGKYLSGRQTEAEGINLGR
jgi:hypothetical protein